MKCICSVCTCAAGVLCNRALLRQYRLLGMGAQETVQTLGMGAQETVQNLGMGAQETVKTFRDGGPGDSKDF